MSRSNVQITVDAEAAQKAAKHAAEAFTALATAAAQLASAITPMRHLLEHVSRTAAAAATADEDAEYPA